MQRASLLAKGNVLSSVDLGLPATGASPVAVEIELDKESIEQALTRAAGVVSQAAAELGLSRQALYRRMDRLGISRSSQPA
jgi:transcriptional regulator of acetoin/glycerol metabolism